MSKNALYNHDVQNLTKFLTLPPQKRQLRIIMATVILSATMPLSSSASAFPAQETTGHRNIALASQDQTQVTSEFATVEIPDAAIKSENPKPLSESLPKESKNLIQKFQDEVKSYFDKISFRKCLDVPLGNDRFKIKGGYCFGVEPAYYGGTDYRRIDEYEFPIELKAGEWKFGNGELLKFNIRQGTKLRVFRLFENFRTALNPNKKGIPVFDWVTEYLPSTSQRILNMNPGEMVHLQIPLFLSASVPFYDSVKSKASVTLTGSKNYGGIFDIFVFRGENDQVHLRILPRFENAEQLELGAKILLDNMSPVAKTLIRILGTDLVKASFYHGKQHLFVADYYLDFTKQEVRDAYDNLLGKALLRGMFSGVTSAAKYVKDLLANNKLEDIRQALTANLTEIERIAKEDLGKPDSEVRIKINMLGTNSPNILKIPLKASLPLLGSISVEISRYLHALTRRYFKENPGDGRWEEKRDFFLFPSWNYHSHTKSRVAKHEEELFRSLNVIMTADETLKNPTDFYSVGFSFDLQDNDYKRDDHQFVLDHIYEVLPNSIYTPLYENIKKEGLGPIDHSLGKTRTELRYFINHLGLSAVEERFRNKSKDENVLEISRILADYIRSKNVSLLSKNTINENGFQSSAVCKKIGIDSSMNSTDMAAPLCSDIEIIADKISGIVDASVAPAERQALMQSLLYFDLFRKVGPGMFFALIPEEKLEESVKVESKFYLESSLTPKIFTFGNAPDRLLYDELKQQQDMLSEDNPDMRFIGDRNDRTTRTIDE